MIVRITKNGDFKEQSMRNQKMAFPKKAYTEDLKKIAPTVSKLFKDKIESDLKRALNKI